MDYITSREKNSHSKDILFEMYVNRRDDIIKNAGCTVFKKGKRLAYMYVIVGSNGEIYEVKEDGPKVHKYYDQMEENLLEFMMTEEEKDKHPRNLMINSIDSPRR